jgi:hypothetical protein
MTLLTSYALLTAQTPIDETNAQSTIKVKKKAPKEAPRVEQPAIDQPAPPPPAPPQRAADPPPPPLPRIAAPPPPQVRSRVAPTHVIQTDAGKPAKVVPWITLGASVAATAVGIFFAVRTTKTLEEQAELEFEINTSKSRVNIPEEFTANQKAVFVNSITATVLISAGISGALASTIALSMD